ncbi:hypothetical protein [Streptomyces cupreus]|uniref:Uncharacterized protein n=1 Tax=Streptomyces cupreus TaxID=2759956 RepID=A0A7X1M8D7_9ACTN|nr:hypothetical protein [Streptomyces cupreus]MBC2902109.1 hypothetical protein [Streptomyces cupreus]
MDASVVGLVGAAVGALGAVAGGWISALGQGRQQQRQLQADREYRREVARREAYGACIASTKLLSNAWWRFSDVVWNEQSTPEQWRAAFAEVHEAWTQFSTAVAAVAVAGPVTAAEAAEELRVAMYEWERAGMDWFAAARREGHGRLDEYSDRFQQAWQAKRAPDRAFQQAARRALGTEEP